MPNYHDHDAKVSLTVGSSLYRCSAATLDRMIEDYLPASPAQLRAICEEQADIDLSDVTDVTSFLVMLGDWEEGL